MPWHSTAAREEILLGCQGMVRVEIESAIGRRRKVYRLERGASLFLPAHTRHRVINRSRRPSIYLYFTA